MRGAAAALSLALAAAPGAPAAACSAALALGLDVSSSVDADEALLQKRGLAAAFRDRQVLDAILSGPGDGVMAVVYEWSGFFEQEVIVGWSWLADEAAIAGFADRIEASERRRDSWPTSLGRAVEFGTLLHAQNPRDCLRRIIDISGDGPNNHGAGPDWYANEGVLDGFTVNGLAIGGAATDPADYYREHLIHGPGAFVEIAADYDDYPRAILRKLVRELQAPVASR